MRAPEQFATFVARIEVTIRLCRAHDLRPLEWFGWFTPHRAMIEEAFDRQAHGEVLMLVAESGGFPVGQLWIDLAREADTSAGFLWALRVLPGLQGAGIGSRLLATAEQLLAARGRSAALIGVERHNEDARRLYERLGYSVRDAELELVRYTTPDGREETMVVDEWMLRKELVPSAPAADGDGATREARRG